LDGPRNAAPTLSVKSRPVGERQRPLVIGRKDQAVAQTEGVVVDRKARNLVSQRDGNEKKDPRIKLREENEAATRRATTPDKPKSKSKIVSRPADKELRGVSTSGQSAIGIRREPQADARASSKRASVKKPAETPKVSTAKATSKRSSKPDEPSKTSTRPVTSQRTSEPTEPEKKSSGPRISMRKSQEPSEPKAGTSKRTSDAKKSVGTTKKATTSVKATGTKTVSKSTTRTTKAEDRVRELERENERLRKLLDKDSAGLATKRDGGTGSRSAPKKTLVGGNKGKAAATTAKTSGKTSSKTGATTRKKSDSKKPSTKPE
jgi:hypothetical protein